MDVRILDNVMHLRRAREDTASELNLEFTNVSRGEWELKRLEQSNTYHLHARE